MSVYRDRDARTKKSRRRIIRRAIPRDGGRKNDWFVPVGVLRHTRIRAPVDDAISGREFRTLADTEAKRCNAYGRESWAITAGLSVDRSRQTVVRGVPVSTARSATVASVYRKHVVCMKRITAY